MPEWNDRRVPPTVQPAVDTTQGAARKEALRQHDSDKRQQHKWGQCDHGCCHGCAKAWGDKRTHTKVECAGVAEPGAPLGY